MSTENWTFLYRFLENTASLSIIGLAVLSLFVFKKLSFPFQVFAISCLMSGVAELIAWYLFLKNLETSYNNALNHVTMFLDAVLTGYFFYLIVVSKGKKWAIIILVSIIIAHNLFVVISSSLFSSTKYNSASASIIFCIIGLIVFTELSKRRVTQTLSKQSEAIVTMCFIISNLLLVIYFFIYPSIYYHSQIAALKVATSKNAVVFVASLGIFYGIWRNTVQLKKPKPTSSPTLSPPLRGQN